MARVERDRELLIPVSGSSVDDDASSKPCFASSSHHSGRETFYKVVRSWASKKFMTGCVILLPIAITFYITWCFIHFVDGFFSPIYAHLGIDIFGLGFVTSITFIFSVGVFMSSWLGASVLSLGEWFIKRMPFVRHIYNASKQISSAISPDQNTQAFKEVAIIRHPRVGEYMHLASSRHMLISRITQVRRYYAVSTSPPIIFILVIYSWSMPMMLLGQTYQFGKELKSLCPVECQFPRSCQHWIQGLFRWI